jgi:hypothetical protein
MRSLLGPGNRVGRGKSLDYTEFDLDIVIRWGSSAPIQTDCKTIINRANCIEEASNKLLSLKIMSLSAVRVPVFWKNDHKFHEDPGHPGHRINEDVLNEDGTVAQICFGRKKRHVRGEDIQIYLPGDSIVGSRSDYFTVFVEPRKEYRIHVMNGRVILCQKKYFGQELYAAMAEESGEAQFEHRSKFIRNNSHGWRFYNMTDMGHTPQDVMDQALMAIEAHGLHFGAVDVIWGKDKKAYALEVNTAPGLRDANLNLYAQSFIKYYIHSPNTI